MDLTKIDNIVIEGIDYKDYPEFCDAFIASADYDGVPMSDKELEFLDEFPDFIYDSVINSIN